MANRIDFNNQLGESACAACCNMQAQQERREEPSVGMVLDQKIQQARAHVEQLCIVKAKAEAMNLLNMPHTFLQDIIYS